MADQRTPRSSEVRTTTARPDDRWVPPSVLPQPNPQEGWIFRWIRTNTLGHVDNTNVSHRFREGWIPGQSGRTSGTLQVMTDVTSRFRGNVEIGGLLLCKAPAETMAKRRAYYEAMAQQQMESVDNSYMRENDPRMPLLNTERPCPPR